MAHYAWCLKELAHLGRPVRKPSSSGFGEIGSGGDGLPRAASVTWLVPIIPVGSAATPGIHEKVADCAELQTQLLCDGQLHFPAWPLILLKDGNKRATLQVGEHEALLFRDCAVLLQLLLLFSLTSCRKKREQEGIEESLSMT